MVVQLGGLFSKLHFIHQLNVPIGVNLNPAAAFTTKRRWGKGENFMDIVSLIIQLVAGVIGGNAAGRVTKSPGLGGAGNSIVGAIGGVVLGQIIERFTGGAIPADAAAQAASSLDIGSIISSLVGGGAGGAILAGIIGALKKS